MRRTQLYLDSDMWKALHIRSKQQGTTVSQLVRAAVREKYSGAPGRRSDAMRQWVGLWKDHADLRDVDAHIRRLRRGKRLGRLSR